MPSLPSHSKEHVMTNASFFESDTGILLRRRAILAGTGVLSAGALALLGGCEALAAGPKARPGATVADPEADVRILNTALGAELEAVAAYQAGAESGLLQKDVLALAVRFQGHHKEHADALASTVERLGGRPVAARSKYEFPVDRLRSQADVLRFAAGLEKGAVSAYLGAVPLFGDRELARVTASILGDEAMHWAVLRHALGEDPVPAAFVS
jgi:rubrerythrin